MGFFPAIQSPVDHLPVDNALPGLLVQVSIFFPFDLPHHRYFIEVKWHDRFKKWRDNSDADPGPVKNVDLFRGGSANLRPGLLHKVEGGLTGRLTIVPFLFVPMDCAPSHVACCC